MAIFHNNIWVIWWTDSLDLIWPKITSLCLMHSITLPLTILKARIFKCSSLKAQSQLCKKNWAIHHKCQLLTKRATPIPMGSRLNLFNWAKKRKMLCRHLYSKMNSYLRKVTMKSRTDSRTASESRSFNRKIQAPVNVIQSCF